jgi:hypothetical protein
MDRTIDQKLTRLGKRLFELKREKAALEEKMRQCNAQIDNIATKELAAIMSNAEISKFSISGYGTISIREDFFCNVLKENREEMYKWLRKTGNGALITDYVQPATFKAFMREYAEQGNTVPEFVKVVFVPTAHTLAS